jgi:hypothetical protein
MRDEYVSFVYARAKHSRLSPDLLGAEDIQHWLLSLNCRAQASSFDHQPSHSLRLELLRRTFFERGSVREATLARPGSHGLRTVDRSMLLLNLFGHGLDY